MAAFVWVCFGCGAAFVGIVKILVCVEFECGW